MTGQGRKRSVVTAALIVVTCGSMWLAWGTRAKAAMLLVEWAPPRSDLGATPPPAPDFIPPMRIGPVEGLTTGWHAAPGQRRRDIVAVASVDPWDGCSVSESAAE